MFFINLKGRQSQNIFFIHLSLWFNNMADIRTYFGSCCDIHYNNFFLQNNHTHAIECYPCPAGFYCAISGQSEICPAGYYCPAGTGLDWKSCPRGTYSNVLGLYDESQCKPCPAGQFCDGEHLTTPSGKT